MKILFILNTPGFIRYFDTTIEALVARGHDVLLAFIRPDMRTDALEVFSDERPRPTIVGRALERSDRYASLANSLRAGVDYLRYLDDRFRDADYLRNRRRVRAVEAIPVLGRLGDRATLPRPLARLLVRSFLVSESAIPSDPEIERYIGSLEPDLLLVSPLVTGTSPQVDYVKSARALGIPTGLCVASWDNLTNKGLMRVFPDRVFVWNEAQRAEAAEFHGYPPDGVVVTGAQPFDRWFGRAPATSYAEFCARAGLRPDRPYAMFVGSTGNIAKADVEEQFVREWIEQIRGFDDPLAREIGILVRPHPDRHGDWDSVDLRGLSNVTLWPPRRPNSVAPDARADYFDSIHHAAVVVGINTSAMVEAAVIGRPVLSIRVPEFEQAQRGTIHFRYLLPENGGFVLLADDLEEHVRQLLEAVAAPEIARPMNERFVDAFIRPHGQERECTGILADGIEELGTLRLRPRGVPLVLRPLQGILWLVALLRSRKQQAGLDRVREFREREREKSRRRKERAARLARVLPVAGRLLEAYADRREALAEKRADDLRRRLKREALARKQLKDAARASVLTGRSIEMLTTKREERD